MLIRDPKKPDMPAQALPCTDLDRTPEETVTWFVRRWRIETTFEEVRTHLGAETQRQWSDRAIARTTPCLLALFSIVTLLARTLPTRQRCFATAAARHPKARPTFSDALAAVRRAIWREQHFQTSPRQTDRRTIPFRLPKAWAYALCNAAWKSQSRDQVGPGGPTRPARGFSPRRTGSRGASARATTSNTPPSTRSCATGGMPRAFKPVFSTQRAKTPAAIPSA